MEVTQTTETKFPLLAQNQGGTQPAPTPKAAEPQKEVPAAVAPVEEPVAAVPAAEPQKVVATKEDDDIDDAVILKALNKKNGTDYKSLDELRAKPIKPSPEEEAEAEKKLLQESIEWAMGTGKLTKEKYDKSVIDKSKNKRDIALALFTQEARSVDPDITPEEAEEMFRDEYREDADADSRERKLAQKKMDKVAEDYIKANYSDVDELPGAYKEYKSTTEKHKAYSKQAREAIEALPRELTFSIPYTGIDDKVGSIDIPFSIDEKEFAALKKDFASPYAFEVLGGGKGEIKPEAIAEAFKAELKNKNFESILATAAKAYGEKAKQDMLAHLKGFKANESNINSGGAQSSGKPAPPTYNLLKKAQDRR